MKQNLKGKLFMTKQRLAKFWAKVNKDGPMIAETPCWQWLGNTNNGGYGQFYLHGQSQLAHRISYELAIARIPLVDSFHGMCALHRCDNPQCVNPSHLFLGTVGDNNRDRHLKGRDRKAV